MQKKLNIFSELTKKWVYHSSREINDTSNHLGTEESNFYYNTVTAKLHAFVSQL